MIDAYAAGHQQQSVEEFRGIEGIEGQGIRLAPCRGAVARIGVVARVVPIGIVEVRDRQGARGTRSEEHTSELQSLMRISYAVFCLKKKKTSNLRILYITLQSSINH